MAPCDCGDREFYCRAAASVMLCNLKLFCKVVFFFEVTVDVLIIDFTLLQIIALSGSS